MNLAFSPVELAFQQEARRFLADRFPAATREKLRNGIPLDKEDWVNWQRILYEKGWAAANWPVQYGGTGWSATQRYIWDNELALAGAMDVMTFGMKMVGPVIYTFGTEEQKQRFLPDIRASRVWWCQGYSEPNAGSDLAGLTTTARRDGDDYIVTGSKTWTTLAHYADWIFCLVRTGGAGVKNQEAISFLLIDMHSPGIKVSPIMTLEGHREVNEVHFESVRVPVSNRIGEEGRGWTYAKLLLTHERTSIARVASSKALLRKLKRCASTTDNGGSPLLEDPAFGQKVAEVEIELLALEYTELRALAAVATGQAPGPESSILKIKGTEVAQALSALFVEVAGYYCLPFVKEQFTPDFAGHRVGSGDLCNVTPTYFNHRKLSIYGGSNEIQRNIIAKAVLGL
jgi:alkylation response protein AidB-like acyl-CoA dehydrogenase